MVKSWYANQIASNKSTHLSKDLNVKKTVQPVVVVKGKTKKKKRPALTNAKSLTMIDKTPFLGQKKWSRNMPYHEVYVQSVPATPETAALLFYSLNGVFDPEVAPGGHQPMGFDQALQFYEHYTVTNASWTINYSCADTAIGLDTTATVGYYISPDDVGISGSDRIIENGLMKRKFAICNSANPKSMGTLSGKLNMSKYFGKKIIDEDDYRGDAASKPVEQVYLVLFANQLVGASTNFTITYDVTFNYTVVFTEPRKLPQS